MISSFILFYLSGFFKCSLALLYEHIYELVDAEVILEVTYGGWEMGDLPAYGTGQVVHIYILALRTAVIYMLQTLLAECMLARQQLKQEFIT